MDQERFLWEGLESAGVFFQSDDIGCRDSLCLCLLLGWPGAPEALLVSLSQVF